MSSGNLNNNICTFPLSFLMLGLAEFFLLHIIPFCLRLFHGSLCGHNCLKLLVQIEEINNKNKKKNQFSKKIDEKDESLCREDVEMVMGSLGIFCHPEDDDDDEKIRVGYDEIPKVFEEKEPSLDEVKGAFDVFDENRDGFIDTRELQRVLCVLGFKEGLEMDRCRNMIRAFDENGDGRIDFHEFVKLMENTF